MHGFSSWQGASSCPEDLGRLEAAKFRPSVGRSTSVLFNHTTTQPQDFIHHAMPCTPQNRQAHLATGSSTI